MKNKLSKLLLGCLSAILFLPANLQAQSTIQYDIVLTGGRVIDPETKLDAIKNVGIIQNRIAQISSVPLTVREVLSTAT